MVIRLVNRRLEREYDMWLFGITGESFWVPRGITLHATLKSLARQVRVPQRCIAVAGAHVFVIVPFQGATAPGCYPMNSCLYDRHCNICDDEVAILERCCQCGILTCSECFEDAVCWICRSDADNYIPCCRRERLLDEVYQRLETHPQPIDHSQFDFFPFRHLEELT